MSEICKLLETCGTTKVADHVIYFGIDKLSSQYIRLVAGVYGKAITCKQQQLSLCSFGILVQ